MRLATLFINRCAGSRIRRTIAISLATIWISGCGSGVDTTATTPAATPAAPPDTTAAPQMSPAAPPSTTPDATAEVSLVNGEKLKSLLAQAKGKTLVINVWATFCVPCLEEMPELAQFYSERDADKVAFLSLSADPAYSIDDVVKPFVVERKIPFPVYLLDDVPPDTLIELLGVQSTKWSGELPGTFVLDETGALKHSWLERVHLNDLKAAVASAVAG